MKQPTDNLTAHHDDAHLLAFPSVGEVREMACLVET